MLQYGILLEDMAMLQVNTAAIVLNIAYTIFYYLYCTEKWNEIYKPSAFGAALVAVLVAYINYEDPSLVETRYGLIVTVLMLLLLGSPLLEVVSCFCYFVSNFWHCGFLFEYVWRLEEKNDKFVILVSISNTGFIILFECIISRVQEEANISHI